MSEQPFDANAYKVQQGRDWGQSARGWKQHWTIWERGAQHVNERLVELAQIQPGHKVLDIASGLGEPAFTAARQVGPTGEVIGTDIAPEMLAMARDEATTLGLNHTVFREMDAEAPDLPPGSFHAILCRFGLIFLPNVTTALRRLRQLLVPGGRFAAAVWGAPAQVPALSMPLQIIRQVRCLPPPPADRPGPFSLGDEQVLRQHFRVAGFAELYTEHLMVTLEYTSLKAYLEERLSTSANYRLLLSEASEEERTTIENTLVEALQPYTESNGTIRLPNETLCIVGW